MREQMGQERFGAQVTIKVEIPKPVRLSTTTHGVIVATRDWVDGLANVAGIDVTRTRLPGRHGLMHVHSPGPFAWLLMAVHKGPVVATVHVTPGTLTGNHLGAARLAKLMRLWWRSFYLRADVLVCPTAQVEAEIVPLVGPGKTVVIPNVVKAPTTPDVGARPGAANSRPLIVAVGQVQPRKGVAEFIEAGRQLPQADFMWIGKVPYGPFCDQPVKVRRAIRDLPSNVQFVGQLPRLEVLNWMAAATLFYLPTKHETFGMALIESAMVGCPPILPASAIVPDEVRACSVVAQDPVKELRRLLDSPEALETERARIATNCEFFSERAWAAQVKELYNSLDLTPA